MSERRESGIQVRPTHAVTERADASGGTRQERAAASRVSRRAASDESSGGMLGGVTVLDLASVGPAARASRWLADYGARVVKVGPVPEQGGAQIVPPFHSYSAHRGMQRALFDLKSADGRDAFLRLADHADVVIESFRPGVVDRLGIGWDALAARNPRVVYCSTSGFGQRGPHAQWAGHDLNYLAVGGFLHCNNRGPGGQPPVPGLTIADSAGGGMQSVI